MLNVRPLEPAPINLKERSHTGRELQLMLSGAKPLAMFYAEVSELPWEELIPEIAFAPYVSDGCMVRGELQVAGGFSQSLRRKTRIQYVFFCLASEAWRLPAMVLLKRSHEEAGRWNETLERIECALLGYTKEETDAWCRHSFKAQSPSA